jgi:hypothetical protein
MLSVRRWAFDVFLFCNRRWFVAALQNGVVQIGCVRLAGVECDDDALALKIDMDALHSIDTQERRAQPAHAFVAIFPLGRDLDCFENRVIGTLRIKRVTWFRLVWSC